MSIKRMWCVLVFLMIIDNSDCVLNIERALEKPSIRPLNLKTRIRDTTVFVFGRFHCPDDTYADIDYGTIEEFQKVLDSTKNSTDFELVLYHDSEMHSKLTLRSKSSSESLIIYLNDKEEKSVQTEHFGTKCEVGITSLSDSKSITYRSHYQDCEEYVTSDYFVVGLNKSGEIMRLDSDMFCLHSNAEFVKYFTSMCSKNSSSEPPYVTFNKDKMADDKVSLLYLIYTFQPGGSNCLNYCLADTEQWVFYYYLI